MNNNQNRVLLNDPRKKAQDKYNSARVNLILLIALTVVNLVLLAFDSQTMMLFSATVPYYAVILGMAFQNTVALVVSVCIAVIILLVYLICWVASKKNYGWLIAALVLFILDTLAMIGIYILAEDFSGILDVVIHAWILYELIVGVISGAKLKKLPVAETVESENVQVLDEAE